MPVSLFRRPAAKIGMWILSSIALSLILCASCRAQAITVAVAADFADALDEIATRFEQQSGAHVKRVSGASGNLYEQIRQGAPFDVFFAANMDYPKRLEAAGLAVPGTYFEYVQGKLALVVSAGTRVDLR